MKQISLATTGFELVSGNRPQEPKAWGVEFFPMEEVLNEEIEIHG
jgi:hypothetical protein